MGILPPNCPAAVIGTPDPAQSTCSQTWGPVAPHGCCNVVVPGYSPVSPARTRHHPAESVGAEFSWDGNADRSEVVVRVVRFFDGVDRHTDEKLMGTGHFVGGRLEVIDWKRYRF